MDGFYKRVLNIDLTRKNAVISSLPDYIPSEYLTEKRITIDEMQPLLKDYYHLHGWKENTSE
ncbi:MAG: hypothetical protein V1714_01985 [Pseudomonadota bacterium]